MGLFGLSAALAIAAGRVRYGYIALMESRYSTMTAWVFIALVMLTSILRDRTKSRAAACGWFAMAIGALLLYGFSLPNHLAASQRSYRDRLQGLAVYLFSEASPAGLPMVPTELDWPSIRRLVAHVEQAGWRTARPLSITWVFGDQLPATCDTGVVEFSTVEGTHLMAGGWAYLPTVHRPADGVLVTSGSPRQVAVLQPPLIGRGDIGRRFDTDAALVTGWTIDARPENLGGAIEFWALNVETLHAYKLCQAP
jgi:hypothetical protein